MRKMELQGTFEKKRLDRYERSQDESLASIEWICCFWGHRPEAGVSFSMLLRFGFMCVVVHVRCWHLAILNGVVGWGVITFLPTVRSGYLRHVSEVYMCVVDVLPVWTGGWEGCNNLSADCKIRLFKTCFRSVHVRCWRLACRFYRWGYPW